jgi:hypothetical protein
MATRTLEKMVRFFEEGQSAILADIVFQEPEPEEELEALGNWDDLNEKMRGQDIEKLMEVGIGTGADDSEWFRTK